MAGPSRGDGLSFLSHEQVLTGTVVQKLWQAGGIIPQCPLRCAVTETVLAVAYESSVILPCQYGSWASCQEPMPK